MHRRVVALSAALVTLAGLGVLGSPAGPAAATARASATAPVTADAATPDADPLTVTLDSLSPAVIPARGDIEVSGTVTNTDDDTWTTIKVYPFVSAEPITTAADLDAAAASEPDAVVGERVGVDGTHNATIDSLAPGATATFDFSVPRGLLDATAPGVYWFGVQALGQGPDGRDNEADGRARTFLPLVPQRATGSLPVSVVVPLRRPISYADDGSLSDPAGWLQALSKNGRLRSLVDLGASAGGRPVSWLVDPALVDAVRRLAAGNPARSLQPTLPADDTTDPDATTSPSPSATPSPGDGSSGATDGATPAASAASDREPRPLTENQLARADAGTRAVASAAQDWLARLTSAIRPGDELLVLPYGDLDVSGAAAHAPRAYQVARARADARPVLAGLDGVRVTPAVGAPSGYLSTKALGLVGTGTTALVTDQMFTDPPGTVARTGGHDLVVTSTSAASGGPGPDDPTAVVAMRQRLLAQAALRFLGDDPQPLVTVLPYDWNPRDATAFFSGLDAPWLGLENVSDATERADPTPVEEESLRYPHSQQLAELGATSFDAAGRLMSAGTALQSLLTLNNVVGATVRDEALTSASYAARSHPASRQAGDDDARSWIDARLGKVTVSAPTSVNLLSSTGRFNATVHNGLDQPVTVALDASTDTGLRVTGPRRVRVPPGGIASVPLGARTDETGVHRVLLRLTDQRGVPLGTTAQLSIRSSQVSGIIWVFIALGAALLFGTIAVRLFRRIRAARREAASRAPETHPGDGRPADPTPPVGARTPAPSAPGRS